MKRTDLSKIGIIYESMLKAAFSKEEIAEKHGVDVETVSKLLQQGTKIEKEHTDDEKTAMTIASHHLYEILDYYSELKKVEK